MDLVEYLERMSFVNIEFMPRSELRIMCKSELNPYKLFIRRAHPTCCKQSRFLTDNQDTK
jgi:hypothetical protein